MTEGFCEECGVSLDLHDGPDTCEYAESKARTLDVFNEFLSNLFRG